MDVEELVKSLREDRAFLTAVAWRNAVSRGSEDVLKTATRCGDAADTIETLQAQIIELTAERDALLKQLKMPITKVEVE